MSRDENGAATLVGIALISVLGFVAVIAVGIGGLVATHRRAATAADLAALAAATAREHGTDPCTAAARIALANRAEIDGCVVGADSTLVVVKAEIAWPSGYTVRARARAGP